MAEIVAGFILISICFVLLGAGYFLFGKPTEREACGSVPTASHEDCPSRKSGLCPVEDLSGTVKMARTTQIRYPNS